MSGRYGRYVAALGGLIAVAAGAAFSQPSQKPDKPASERQQATAERQAAPVVVKVVPASKTAAEAEAEKRENERKADIERKGLVTNVFLAVFALGQLIVTGITLFGLRHAKLAAEAADKAADAAKASADIAAESAQRQLRAYVTVKETAITELAVGQTPDVVIAYENVGQTPAHDVTVKLGVKVPRLPQLEAFELEPPHPSDSRSVVFPGQGGTLAISMPPALDDDFIRKFRAGVLSIYAYGEIRYRDEFGKPRYTRFRLVHDHTRRPHHFALCPEGNEAA